MIEWLKQRAVHIEAQELIKSHGKQKAWALTFERSRNLESSEVDRLHALRVRRQVEKLTGIKLGPDTATRYLQDSTE